MKSWTGRAVGTRIVLLLAASLAFACSSPPPGAVRENRPPVVEDLALSTSEDVPVQGTLRADDPDGDALQFEVVAGPEHGVLTLGEGGAFTYAPASEFAGSDAVVFRASDGTAAAEGHLELTVVAVDDAPVVTAQRPLTTPEDSSLTFGLEDLTIVDDGPGPLSLSIQGGAHYTVAGASVVPEADFHGTLSVPVVVSDGLLESAAFLVSVTVTPVNDRPAILGQATVTSTEDAPRLLSLADLVVSDPDTASDALSVVVLDGAGYSHSGATVTPGAEVSGELRVSVQLSDGLLLSDPFELLLTVAAVDDPPVIAGQLPITAAEDTVFGLALDQLVVTDPDSTSFTLEVKDGTGYTHAGGLVTPAPDFNGLLQVSVTVSDATSTSAPFLVGVTVTPVNDAPVVTGQVPLSTPEESALTLSVAELAVVDDGPGPLSLTVLPGSHYSVDGLTVLPEPDFSGALAVSVTVSDGLLSSAPFPLSVTIEPVNDAPVVLSQRYLGTAPETAVTVALSHLVVVDPDTAPGGLTVQVLDGTGYVHDGPVVTPEPGFTGLLDVQLQVHDGFDSSDVFVFSLDVGGTVGEPVIVGQTPITILEDGSHPVDFGDLQVVHPRLSYPSGFTLTVLEGADYTLEGSTITPAAEFSGPLSVWVSVNDGTYESELYELIITVLPVDDPPVIAGQQSLSATEDTAFELTVDQLEVLDPDSLELTLEVQDGAGYTHVGNLVTPAPDFYGTLQVSVTVADATSESAPYSVEIEVEAVNDLPRIDGQLPLATQEDTSRTLTLADLSVVDPDGDPFLTLEVGDGPDYARDGATIMPSPDYHGVLSIPVRVSDGLGESEVFPLLLTVTPVNDAPSITAVAELFTAEETPIEIGLASLTVSDPDGPGPLSVTVLSGEHYTSLGATLTPEPDFNGALTVPVVVSDGLLQSDPFLVQVTVSPANDPPVILGQATLTTPEETPLLLSVDHLNVIDPDAAPGELTLMVLAGDGYSFSGLEVTPNAEVNGEIVVQVQVRDGVSPSAPFGLRVTVTPVNDAPVIAGPSAPLNLLEEGTRTIGLADLVVLDPDGAYPAGFTLTVADGANYTRAGEQITPDVDFNGELFVPVTVSDGELESDTFVLTVTVQPVNDPPVITGQAQVLAIEDVAFEPSVGDLVIVDPDTTAPTLLVEDGAGYTHVGNLVTPALNLNGPLLVQVRVGDGEAVTEPFSLLVDLAPVNDPPAITGQLAASTPEETAWEVLPGHLVISDPDLGDLFTVLVGAGTQYETDGARVTPELDFNGTLTVPVRVSDGLEESATFELQLEVTPVNDAPVITAQQDALSSAGEPAAPVTLTLADLVVTDPDDAFPGDFTLSVGDGLHFTRDGAKITAEPGFEGIIEVPVTVHDGTAGSNTFLVQIDATWDWLPVAQADLYKTTGNTELSVSAPGVSGNDSDQEGAITLTAASGASTRGGTFTLAEDGAFTYLPPAGFVGDDTFTYTIADSAGREVEGTVTVTVGPRVWYVDNRVATTGDGRSTKRFKQLSEVQPVSLNDDTIFVFAGSGAYGPVVLKPGQKLVGEASGLVREPNPPIPPGPRPMLAGAGDLVTLASGNVVSGLSLSPAGRGLYGLNLAGASVADVQFFGGASAIVLQRVSGALALAKVTSTNASGDALVFDNTSTSVGGTLSVDQTVVTGAQGRGLAAVRVAEVTITDSNTSLSAKKAALDLQDLNLLDATVQSLGTAGGVGGGLRLEAIRAGRFALKGQVTASGSNAVGVAIHNSNLVATLGRADLTAVTTGIDLVQNAGSFTLGPASAADADDGGVIRNATEYGVRLSNVRDVKLYGLSILNSARDGLFVPDGSKVTNLELRQALVDGAGTTFFQYALNFGSGRASGTAQLDGTALIASTELKNLSHEGLFLENAAGALNLSLQDVSISGTLSSGSGMIVRADGTGSATAAQVTLSLLGCHFSGIDGAGDALNVGTEGVGSTLALTVENSFFTNTLGRGDNGVRINSDGAGTLLTFDLKLNQFSGWNGDALSLSAGDQNAQLRGTIAENHLSTAPAGFGDGIDILLDADPATTATKAVVALTNNTIQAVGGYGIYAVTRGASGTPAASHLSLIATGNTVGAAGLSGFGEGVLLRATENTSICAALTNNTSVPGAGPNAYRLSQLAPSVFQLEGLVGTASTFVDTYNNGNPVSATGTYSAAACERP